MFLRDTGYRSGFNDHQNILEKRKLNLLGWRNIVHCFFLLSFWKITKVKKLVLNLLRKQMQITSKGFRFNSLLFGAY